MDLLLDEIRDLAREASRDLGVVSAKADKLRSENPSEEESKEFVRRWNSAINNINKMQDIIESEKQEDEENSAVETENLMEETENLMEEE